MAIAVISHVLIMKESRSGNVSGRLFLLIVPVYTYYYCTFVTIHNEKYT